MVAHRPGQAWENSRGSEPSHNERTLRSGFEVRAEIWRRDEARCTFVGTSGHRCGSTHQLQLHHYQALFKFIQFLDVESGFFAPAANGQGCERGTCGIEPIPQAEIPGLLAYVRTL